MSKKQTQKDPNTSQPQEVVRPKYVGTVIDCTRVNVRSDPDMHHSTILAAIPCDSVVEIQNGSHEVKEWYAVTTDTGISGYILGDYLAISEV